MGAHPGSLGERNARNAPCPKPAVCPAQWRTARPARSHRLRSARNATRRPGGVGLSCWAIACGGGPPPKARKSCTGCACASGCGATMALWHGSVATDRRPARRPPSVKYVSHRNGAAASPPDTRTARRGPHAAREGALLVCFYQGVNTGMKAVGAARSFRGHDACAEHVRVPLHGPLEPPAPRGPRVEPRGARAGHNR